MSIKTRFDRCCRKYKAGIQDECSEKNNSEFQNSDLSSKESFLANRRRCPSQKQKDWNKTENGMQENTSPSNIYWRYYWPGSYAPRGVIDQCICCGWGLPYFFWLCHQPNFWVVKFVKLLSFKSKSYLQMNEDAPDFHDNIFAFV